MHDKYTTTCNRRGDKNRKGIHRPLRLGSLRHHRTVFTCGEELELLELLFLSLRWGGEQCCSKFNFGFMNALRGGIPYSRVVLCFYSASKTRLDELNSFPIVLNSIPFNFGFGNSLRGGILKRQVVLKFASIRLHKLASRNFYASHLSKLQYCQCRRSLNKACSCLEKKKRRREMQTESFFWGGKQEEEEEEQDSRSVWGRVRWEDRRARGK